MNVTPAMLLVKARPLEYVHALLMLIILMLSQLLLVLLQIKLSVNVQLKQDFPSIIHLQKEKNVLDLTTSVLNTIPMVTKLSA